MTPLIVKASVLPFHPSDEIHPESWKHLALGYVTPTLLDWLIDGKSLQERLSSKRAREERKQKERKGKRKRREERERERELGWSNGYKLDLCPTYILTSLKGNKGNGGLLLLGLCQHFALSTVEMLWWPIIRITISWLTSVLLFHPYFAWICRFPWSFCEHYTLNVNSTGWGLRIEWTESESLLFLSYICYTNFSTHTQSKRVQRERESLNLLAVRGGFTFIVMRYSPFS